MHGMIPATKPMLKASGIVNLNEITKIDHVYCLDNFPIKVMGTAIKFTNSLDLPYVSMYVKQDNVKPSFFELLK